MGDGQAYCRGSSVPESLVWVAPHPEQATRNSCFRGGAREGAPCCWLVRSSTPWWLTEPIGSFSHSHDEKSGNDCVSGAAAAAAAAAACAALCNLSHITPFLACGPA